MFHEYILLSCTRNHLHETLSLNICSLWRKHSLLHFPVWHGIKLRRSTICSGKKLNEGTREKDVSFQLAIIIQYSTGWNFWKLRATTILLGFSRITRGSAHSLQLQLSRFHNGCNAALPLVMSAVYRLAGVRLCSPHPAPLRLRAASGTDTRCALGLPRPSWALESGLGSGEHECCPQAPYWRRPERDRWTPAISQARTGKPAERTLPGAGFRPGAPSDRADIAGAGACDFSS